MFTVTSSNGSYPVLVEHGALERLPGLLDELTQRGVLWLAYDAALETHHALPLRDQLADAGYAVNLYAVPSGEQSKSQQQLWRLYDWLIAGGVERRDTLLALGGGVVGDLAGYAAASVLRGIGLVQLPTTLLAMVDAAVGGKTAINHPLGKNLIGAFYPPQLVVVDTATLASLPSRELRAGWAEVIKHGVIRDAALFDDLEAQAARAKFRIQASGLRSTTAVASVDEQHDSGLASDAVVADAERLADLVRRAVKVKVTVVSADEHERGERITLNYGHTIGHAIEAVAGYGTLLHGEAVAIGMHAAASIAARVGLCNVELLKRQQGLLHAYGLATDFPADIDRTAVLAATLRDKKVARARIRWVLPTAVGHVVVRDDIAPDLVRTVVQELP
jgi:3-dehydroquinate synthase